MTSTPTTVTVINLDTVNTLSGGQVAGIVIGSILALVLAFMLGVFIYRRRVRNNIATISYDKPSYSNPVYGIESTDNNKSNDLNTFDASYADVSVIGEEYVDNGSYMDGAQKMILMNQ